MMTTELFYFSGTGNSFFIGKELSKRLQNCQLTPMVKALNEDTCTTTADTIGFIFPVHALSIPIIVKKFLEKLKIGSSQYIFAIATRGGTSFHGFKIIDSILDKKQHKLSARFIINMVLNDARNKIFTKPDEEALAEMAISEVALVEKIAAQVSRRDIVNEPDRTIRIRSANSKLGTLLIESLVLFEMSLVEKTMGVDYFYSDGNSNGCGVCQRVCLSKKVKVDLNRPIWKKDVFCSMCYSCINYCPQQAIQIRDVPYIKSFTAVNGRYHHPTVKIGDMDAQK